MNSNETNVISGDIFKFKILIQTGDHFNGESSNYAAITEEFRSVFKEEINVKLHEIFGKGIELRKIKIKNGSIEIIAIFTATFYIISKLKNFLEGIEILTNFAKYLAAKFFKDRTGVDFEISGSWNLCSIPSERHSDVYTSPSNQDFIKQLREEGMELKECFNRQCFQVFAIISALYVFLVRFMFSDNLSVGLAAYVALILIIAVINVGIYKFEGANRITGFMNHLERKKISGEFDNFSLSLETYWESLLKAWRVFHSTIEDEMYYCWNGKWNGISSIWRRIQASLLKGKLKAKYRNDKKYRWYLPKMLVHPEANFSPGNYLRRMIFMLNVLGAIALITIFVASVAGDYSKLPNFDIPGISLPESWNIYKYNIIFTSINTLVCVIIHFYIWNRPRRFIRKQEFEINSIHSFSIVWGLVEKAHQRTLTVIKYEKPLRHYSFILSCMALHLIKFGIDKAHAWKESSMDKPISDYIRNILQEQTDFPSKVIDNLKLGLNELK